MTTALIFFSVILVLSVIAHYFLWRSSKKHYEECMKQSKALKENLEQLAANDTEIDRMLDEAEGAIDRIDEGIEDLRSGRFMRIEKPNFDN